MRRWWVVRGKGKVRELFLQVKRHSVATFLHLHLHLVDLRKIYQVKKKMEVKPFSAKGVFSFLLPVFGGHVNVQIFFLMSTFLCMYEDEARRRE